MDVYFSHVTPLTERERCSPDHYKDNTRHMLVGGYGCEPDHDPPDTGCEGCGYLDDEGVEATDLAWCDKPVWAASGQWLCLECH